LPVHKISFDKLNTAHFSERTELEEATKNKKVQNGSEINNVLYVMNIKQFI